MSLTRRAVCASLLPAALAPCMARAQAASPIEVGVLPNVSARVLMAQYQPMREYLARELARPVQVSTAPDWAAFHRRTLALDYDLIVSAAHLARLAQIERGYVPLLAYAPRIKGLLVVSKAHPIAGLGELSGQTVVLSNPQSLVTLRAMQWLADNGLHAQRQFTTIKTPTDDSVGNVLLRGDAIAAIASGGEFRTIPEALRAQLSVHTVFAEVAGFVVLASPQLAARDAQALKQRLQQFAAGTAEGKAFFEATGFTTIQELEPGAMEAMDVYVESTRRLLAA